MQLFNKVGDVVVIGNSAVGKTSLIKTFLSSGLEFSHKYNMTIGVEPSAKSIQITSFDDPVKLIFLDSTGMEVYHGVLFKYWKNPSMLLMVYDVTSQLSFANLDQWLELTKNVKWKNSDRPVASAIFGNKTDATGRRTIPYEKGKQIADQYQMQYFEGSAKMNEGINEVFQWFAERWQQHCSRSDN